MAEKLDPESSKWHKTGKPKVIKFRRLVERVGRVTPEAKSKASAYTDELESLLDITSCASAHSKMAIEDLEKLAYTMGIDFTPDTEEYKSQMALFDERAEDYKKEIIKLRAKLLEICDYITSLQEEEAKRETRCPKCSKPIVSGAKFCGFCGAKLRE